MKKKIILSIVLSLFFLICLGSFTYIFRYNISFVKSILVDKERAEKSIYNVVPAEDNVYPINTWVRYYGEYEAISDVEAKIDKHNTEDVSFKVNSYTVEDGSKMEDGTIINDKMYYRVDTDTLPQYALGNGESKYEFVNKDKCNFIKMNISFKVDKKGDNTFKRDKLDNKDENIFEVSLFNHCRIAYKLKANNKWISTGVAYVENPTMTDNVHNTTGLKAKLGEEYTVTVGLFYPKDIVGDKVYMTFLGQGGRYYDNDGKLEKSYYGTDEKFIELNVKKGGS